MDAATDETRADLAIRYAHPLGKTPGPFTQLGAMVYTQAYRDPIPERWAGFPEAARTLADVLAMKAGRPVDWQPGPDPWHHVAPPADPEDRRVVLVLSGGKDSTATALLLREQGYQVQLLHVQGINPAYGQEKPACYALAQLLDMPLVVERVKVEKGTWPENPTKNFMLLCLAADVATRTGAGGVAIGMHREDVLALFRGLMWWSDTREALACYRAIFAAHAPGLVLHADNLLNNVSTLEALLRLGSDQLLDATMSCMMPPYRKPRLRARYLEKIGPLRPGRCGACFKCAHEVLNLAIMEGRPITGKVARESIRILRREDPRLFQDPEPDVGRMLARWTGQPLDVILDQVVRPAAED